MDYLNRLWDDTVAGPLPDHYNRSAPPPTLSSADVGMITRSISITRPPPVRVSDAGSGSVPSSPAGSSTPTSPFSPTTARRGWDRLRRKLVAEVSAERAEPRSPSVYDWIVISSLDR